MIDFHKKHGHARVPFTPELMPLAKWVQFQIQSGRAGTMDATRAQKLEALGLVWGRNDEQGWNENYEKLKTHRRIEGIGAGSNGNNNSQKDGNDATKNTTATTKPGTTTKHKPIHDPKLADWMRRQLWDQKRGRLSEEQKKKLDELNFFTDTPKEALVSRKSVHQQVERRAEQEMVMNDAEGGGTTTKGKKSSVKATTTTSPTRTSKRKAVDDAKTNTDSEKEKPAAKRTKLEEENAGGTTSNNETREPKDIAKTLLDLNAGDKGTASKKSEDGDKKNDTDQNLQQGQTVAL